MIDGEVGRSAVMKETVEAVYENGLLRPLRRLQMLEGQRIRVTLEDGGNHDDASPKGSKGRYDFSDLAGCLSSSPRFSADPVATQKELRNEWS
jgi:predicted DNA-binding antitoxin AbrB/MazE fold protein